MKNIMKNAGRIMIAAAMSLLMCMSVYAEETTVNVTWGGLELKSDGSASWSMSGAPADREVEYYQLRFSRMSGGNWNDSYRSVNVNDGDEYYINFGSTGVYRFRVRARFYGGIYTQWSGYSNEVTVTRDDIGSSGSSSLDPAEDILRRQSYSYGPGYYLDGSPYSSYGPGYGPGTGSYLTSGWQQDGKGIWYRFSNGSYPSNGWHFIDNQWYYFDSSGYRVTGWIWFNNSWYYCIPEGPMAKGWNNVGGKWYYMNENGVMQTGYITINGQTFYLDSTGARFESGYTPDGHYFDDNGVMVI